MKKGLPTVKTAGSISNLITGLLLLFVLTGMYSSVSGQTYMPRHYFTFDGASPLSDSMGNTTLNPSYFQSTYAIQQGAVGKGMNLGTGGKSVVVSSTMPIDTAITIEFLFKPSHDFSLTTFITRRDGAVYIKMGYPFIQFITNAVTTAGANIHDEQTIELEGVGRGSYSYYVDGANHQFVFKYNPVTGVKEIWVDGQLPSGFSKTATAGAKFNPNTSNTQNNIFDLSSNVSYDRMMGTIDELAMYQISLPGSQIYKHYTEYQQGHHYSFGSTTLTVPTASPITAGVDVNDYAIGHPSYTVSAVDQLSNFPTPRYKPGHTLLPNFNWIGLEYFGGAYQPSVTTPQAVANTLSIQKELARNFNYSVLVASNTCTYTQYTDPTKFQGAWVQLANQNPQWKSSAITFWAQITPQAAGFNSSSNYISNQSLPTQHYIKNSSGQFLDLNGSVTSAKYWSPAAPGDSIYKDGQTQKFLVSKLLSSLTRPLDFICENGEVMPKPSLTPLSSDPAIVSDRGASGLDTETYLGNRKKKFSLIYRNEFMTMSSLANTKYTEYQISGATSRHKYSEARLINKPINGQIYATPDFYPRWSSNWYTGVSAWNGWKHIIDGRYYELQQGDRLYSPFVAAGWDVNEELNIRPGQWLGLMKVLGMTGAEFYYTGFFNDAPSYNAPNPPPANPAGYAWQAVIPSYAQAVTSRYEDILRGGSLMNGDMSYSVSTPTQPGYSFNTGDARKLVVVRKHDTQNKYAIVGTLQPNSNMIGNAEIEGDASITLNSQTLQFKVRRQGSTYIYDLSDAANPVFYQLDGWHESTHPSRWTKEFNFEAELYDNTPTGSKIKTQVPANTAAGDFRTYTSYVAASGTATPSTLEYNFTVRNQPNYYIWVRARSRGGVSTGMNVNLSGQAAKSISCVTDTAWNWYSIDACSRTAISFLALTNQNYTLQITPSNANLEIDRIYMTIDPTLNLNLNQAVCNASVATVNTSGPTTFCQGGSVTLTASAGTSYLWSNGATTQAITVANSGNYTVTVSNGSGCAAVSSPIAVTSVAKPNATVSASGATSICSGQSVVLTASAGSTYAWSNGATTQSITVSTGGTYAVTVSNSNGCSATSAAQAVSVTTAPTATVSASGSTSFCQGGSVTLSAPAGYSYSWSNGATAQQIVVNTSGTYSVVVSAGAGCTATAQAVQVTVNSLPTATISTTGSTTFCQGGSVNLSSSTGTTYRWSNGATTQTITATTGGTYAVTVTNASGCSSTSSTQAVTVNALPTPVVAAAGATSFCTGGSAMLTATGGQSYVWSNGATGASISVNQSGTYSVIATNANGCSATSNAITTTQNAVPVAVISVSGPTTLAAGQSTILIATGGTSYTWTPGGATTASIQVSSPGTYSVVVSNASNCSATSSVTIQQAVANAAHITTTSPLSFCDGGSATLTATGGSVYLWTPVNSFATSISVNKSGTYYLYAKGVSGSMELVDSAKVTVHEKPMTPTIAITYVPNTAYQLQAYEPSAVSYSWSNGSTGAMVSVNTPQTIHVTATSAFGCTSSAQTMTVSNVLATSCKAVDMMTAYNISDTSAIVGWNPGITGENFTVRYWERGTNVINVATMRGTYSTYTMAALRPGTNYDWTVETTCPGGNYTSATGNFSTLSKSLACGSIPQHLRAANININNAELRWYSTTAEVYALQFRAAGTSVWRSRSYNGSNYAGGATLGHLTPNTTYEWRVATTCSGYTTPYSLTSTFTTLDTCGYMGTVTVISSTASTGMIQWSNKTPMTQIRMRITDMTTGIYRILTLPSNTVDGSYNIKNLTPLTTYKVEVRGRCSTGALGAWTTPVTLTTTNIVARIENNNPLMLNGYPNPTNSELNYSFMTDNEEDYTLRVADLSGRELLQEIHTSTTGPNAGQMNVSHLAKGMYLLIVQKGTLTSHFRFSVE